MELSAQMVCLDIQDKELLDILELKEHLDILVLVLQDTPESLELLDTLEFQVLVVSQDSAVFQDTLVPPDSAELLDILVSLAILVLVFLDTQELQAHLLFLRDQFQLVEIFLVEQLKVIFGLR